MCVYTCYMHHKYQTIVRWVLFKVQVRFGSAHMYTMDGFIFALFTVSLLIQASQQRSWFVEIVSTHQRLKSSSFERNYTLFTTDTSKQKHYDLLLFSSFTVSVAASSLNGAF